MRINADIADGLISDFTAWINKQYGEDVRIREHDSEFTVELLRQHLHTPHPERSSGRVTEVRRAV